MNWSGLLLVLCASCGVVQGAYLRERVVSFCEDSCAGHTSDGSCDDGGPGSDYDICPCGTDCSDCKERAVCSGSGIPNDESKAEQEEKKNSVKACLRKKKEVGDEYEKVKKEAEDDAKAEPCVPQESEPTTTVPPCEPKKEEKVKFDVEPTTTTSTTEAPTLPPCEPKREKVKFDVEPTEKPTEKPTLPPCEPKKEKVTFDVEPTEKPTLPPCKPKESDVEPTEKPTPEPCKPETPEPTESSTAEGPCWRVDPAPAPKWDVKKPKLMDYDCENVDEWREQEHDGDLDALRELGKKINEHRKFHAQSTGKQVPCAPVPDFKPPQPKEFTHKIPPFEGVPPPESPLKNEKEQLESFGRAIQDHTRSNIKCPYPNCDDDLLVRKEKK